MFQKATAILFIIIIACTSFNKAIVLLDFALHKQYIATTICENRHMVHFCCQGKCFLKKQLAKEEDQNKSGLPSQKLKTETLLFYDQIVRYSFGIIIINFPLATHDPAALIHIPGSVFHPPCLS